MAMFAVLKDKMDLALTLSMTLIAFMNLAIKDTIISVMTLGVSMICLAKLYSDQNRLNSITEDPTLTELGIVSSLSVIGVSSVCLLL
jgi:hypothetical protein